MDFGTTITGAVAGMGAELGTVAVAGIGIGVVIFGARKGWAFLKSLV
jgi:hypothetical protein